MKERVAANSLSEGRPRSRLPVFDETWIAYIKGNMTTTGDRSGRKDVNSFQIKKYFILACRLSDGTEKINIINSSTSNLKVLSCNQQGHGTSLA